VPQGLFDTNGARVGNAKPFVWHKPAEQIFERLAGYCGTVTTENMSALS